MTYFGAAEYSADSVESKMATRNFRHSLHNVPCGTLRPNVPRGPLRIYILSLAREPVDYHSWRRQPWSALLSSVPCGTLGKFAKIDKVEKRSTWNIMIVEISVEISLAFLTI